MPLRIDVAGAVSICAELLLYGVFLNLFMFFLHIVIKRRATRTWPSKVFLAGSCMMFVVATTHIGLNLYRLLSGYVYLRETVGPVAYLNDLSRPENVASDIVNAVMTWLGDGLAIYRCYIIWDNNIYVIILPVLLMILSIVANAVAIHYFVVDPFTSIFSPSFAAWINTLYIVALLQNVYTSAFISYRVYRQETAFRAVGLRALNRSENLMPVARIIIESAMGYTAILLVLIILYALNHNAQFILQEMTVPSVGIVFTLITVRLALRNSRAMKMTTNPVSTDGIAWAMQNNRTALSTTDVVDPGQTDSIHLQTWKSSDTNGERSSSHIHVSGQV